MSILSRPVHAGIYVLLMTLVTTTKDNVLTGSNNQLVDIANRWNSRVWNILSLKLKSLFFTPNDNSFVFSYGELTGVFLLNAIFKPHDLSKLCYNWYADLFNRTPSRLLWEAFSHSAITARILFVYIDKPLFVFKYSFTQQSELWQCMLKRLPKVLHGTTGFQSRYC